MSDRVIVIGDVHGCYDEVCDLLEKVSYNDAKDRLIFCGDLVDRGPEPIKVIKLLRTLNAECVLGNHDERYIRYRRHLKRKEIDPAYVIPMVAPYGRRAEFFEEIVEADWEWLEAVPAFVRIAPDWAVIHAGCEPGIELHQQTVDCLLHCRYVRRYDGKMVRSITSVDPRDVAFWTKFWDGRENIIYGHMVTSTKMPVIDISMGGAICVGIDTGCCFGYSLTAMILEPDGRRFSFVSVPAKEAYDQDLVGYSAATTIPEGIRKG